ncbi:MAG: M20 family metallo-hydrolase [bacterium]|nr:M20 family metallo-hydrolase [bacterium]
MNELDSSRLRDLRIDIGRLSGRLEALAQIGDTGDGGNCRLALTDEDRHGRDLVVGWMRDLALEVTVDTVGNVVAVYPGHTDGPPVMTGSHIDTVRTGGRYDGNLGVLAGLEVIETLSAAEVRLPRPVAVGFFTDEEGSRFPPDMLGSLVFVGGMSIEAALDVTDSDGVSVGAELDRIGYRGAAPCPGAPPFAFVELHIEQGPVLEQEGVTIGAVTGVQGISWQEVTIDGQSNHAGTTPMSMRRDAGFAAARAAVAAREIAKDIGGFQVATVGVLDLHPDLVNVVAGRARLCLDMRNIHEQELQQAERLMATSLERIATAEGVGISVRSMARFEPVIFDLPVVDLIEDVARRLGHSTKRLPSGAGHDAQMLARVCPSGMIFVPSHRGLSHNPAEYTAPEDLAAGADVLLQTMIALACWEGDIPQVSPTGGAFNRSERGVGAPIA